MPKKPIVYNRTKLLKQLVRYMLTKNKEKCYFCHKKLENPLKITVHHIDGRHHNNKPANLALAHRSCHKAHHARITFTKKKKRRH